MEKIAVIPLIKRASQVDSIIESLDMAISEKPRSRILGNLLRKNFDDVSNALLYFAKWHKLGKYYACQIIGQGPWKSSVIPVKLDDPKNKEQIIADLRRQIPNLPARLSCSIQDDRISVFSVFDYFGCVIYLPNETKELSHVKDVVRDADRDLTKIKKNHPDAISVLEAWHTIRDAILGMIEPAPNLAEIYKLGIMLHHISASPNSLSLTPEQHGEFDSFQRLREEQ